MIFSKSLDQHSLTHFFGCYILTLTLFIWGVTLWLSVLFAIIAGFLWELIGDEYLCKVKRKCFGIFDSRGGDWLDIIVDVAGIVLAVFVRRIMM